MKYTFRSKFTGQVSFMDAENEQKALELAEQDIEEVTVLKTDKDIPNGVYCISGYYQITVEAPNELSAFARAAETWKASDFSRLHNAHRGDFLFLGKNLTEETER